MLFFTARDFLDALLAERTDIFMVLTPPLNACETVAVGAAVHDASLPLWQELQANRASLQLLLLLQLCVLGDILLN